MSINNVNSHMQMRETEVDIEHYKKMNELLHDVQKICKLDTVHIDCKNMDSNERHILMGVYADYDQNDKNEGILNLNVPYSIYLHSMDKDKSDLAKILDFSTVYCKNIGIDLFKYDFINVFYVFHVLYALAALHLLLTAGIHPESVVEICKAVKIILGIAVDSKINKDYDEKKCTLYNYEALYARQYAYRMFPIVWNIIKYKYDYYFNNKENKK